MKDLKSYALKLENQAIVFCLFCLFDPAGGGQHIGAKPDLGSLNFDNLPRGGNPEIVSLQTPPRTLTMEEQFPSVEAEEEEDKEVSSYNRVPNG